MPNANESNKRLRGPYKGNIKRSCDIKLVCNSKIFHLGTSSTTNWRKRRRAETEEDLTAQAEICYDDKLSMAKAKTILHTNCRGGGSLTIVSCERFY